MANCQRCGATDVHLSQDQSVCEVCYAMPDCPRCGALMDHHSDPAPSGHAVAFSWQCTECDYSESIGVST